ncbi:phosphate ABC transporter permease subunit PstC [Anaeroselena agilis]|uniref:Phosphate transport system permease protein n=1 Tax=Anaeroselena agilis TaxID=3063788 RepID=A0ABU3NZA5_9FIRM|nr:phosphate ABC transporter permease subunit PstC [Selenomonadales bacterium 4137-cl]
MATTAHAGNHNLKLAYDRYMRYLFIASALLLTVIIAAIIIFVGQQGLMTFKEVGPAEFFLTGKWDPPAGQFGALSFILGSIYVTALAVLLGAPLGLAGAIFMAKIAPPRLRAVMRPATDLYVAIPSVVYGFIGLTILVPHIRVYFGVNTGFGLMAAAAILAVMILPTIISISEDAIRSVPRALEEGSLALGATRWQTITGVILPAALPGILTSIILAMARAVGETMAVQMVIGNTPQIAKSLFMPTSTLTSEIVVEMGNTPFGSAWGNSLFLMALALLLLSLAMILVIRRVAGGRVA